MDMFQIGNQRISHQDLLPLLIRYRLLQPFLKELIVDQMIEQTLCSPEEELTAIQQFYAKQQLRTDAEKQAWMQRSGLSQAQLQTQIIRELRIRKYQEATWGNQVEPSFLSQKVKLDRVIYSAIRVKDPEIAQELYFRLKAGESSFPELAKQYSLGAEAQNGGTIGPVTLGSMHPTLAKMLNLSQAGQLWPPTRVEDWVFIIQSQRFLPAQLDEGMRQRLLTQLMDEWIQEQVLPVYKHLIEANQS